MSVAYNGNENFVANSTTFNFTVSKARTNTSLKVNSTTFNQTLVIEYALNNINGTDVHIPDSTVTISITNRDNGGNVYNNISSFTNEKGVLRITDFEFTSGNYTVTLIYEGNENFIGNSTESNFTVSKARTGISANVNNTIYNQTVVVKYNLSNVNATDAHIPDSQVIITIINRQTDQSVYSKASSFSSEEGILNINDFNLISGNYIANVTYEGNSNFMGSSISVPFTVSKANTNVSVNVNDTTFNQNVVVEYSVDNIDNTAAVIPDANVVINITTANNRKVIYSTSASFVNGKGVFNISNYEFAAGNYNVTVTYNGDDNFAANSTKFNFTVRKADTRLSVNANNTIFNKSVLVEYNLSNVNTSAHIPNGRVVVTITDKGNDTIVYSNSRVSFVDERGVLQITDFEFPVSDYTVNVSYAGNANFTGTSASFDFRVSKAHTDVSVNVNNTTFNQNPVIEFAVINSDATGARIPNSQVTIIIMDRNGNPIYSKNASLYREKGSLQITDYEFNVGDYTVNVTYNGGDNFEGSYALADFSVSKARSSISVNVDNVTFNQTVTVDYSLTNADSTGAHIPDGDVNIIITDKSTGNIIYNTISSFVSEKGLLTISGFEFAAGNYSANVTYNGSSDFMGSSSAFDFSVSKARTSVSVNVNNTIFNNTVIIEYVLDNIDTTSIIPDNNVVINIISKSNGNIVYNKISSFAGEKGILNTGDYRFTAGNYTANVTYNGGANFLGTSSLFDFTVSKAHTSILSNASSVVFNDDVEFNVDIVNTDTSAVLDKDTELVSVDIIGDNTYSYHNISSINDANRIFSNLGAGTYDVTVKYEGNSNFLPSDDVKFRFTVSRANTTTVVSAENITYDNHVTVHGDVYSSVTSLNISDYDKVNISVYNNSKIIYTADATVGSLRSGYVLQLLTAGTYTVTASYYSTENFTESMASAEFKVLKANSIIQFNDDYVVIGNNLSFTVTNITDGRSITLKVNNRIYTGSVADGVGYVLIDSGDSGIFDNVSIAFAGDNNYNPSNSTHTVKFIRNDSFTALQLLIDDNTDGNLIFNNNYVFDPNTDDADGVIINKSVNINGNGYAIDATGASSMFNVTGEDVSIANVSINNVNVSDNGSVIAWNGDNGFIDNVAFINNNFDNATVININSNGLIINNSTFTNNTATNGDIISVADAEDTTISNSKFNTNSIVNGNVITIDDCKDNIISDSAFTGNDVDGGVLIDISGCDDTTISNTSFISNDLSSNSVLLNLTNSNNTNIENTNFTDNTVSDNSSIVNIDASRNVNLTNINFNNDNASDDSSIVIINVSDNVELDGVTVDSCNADGDNSIVEVINSTANISNALIANNTADKGNVITIDIDSEVYIDNVTASDNINNNKHRDITYETFVLINSSDIYAGEDAVVNVSIITSYPYDVKGIMIIKADDNGYYFTLTDDEGSFSITDLKGGAYNITGIYTGNQYIDETASNTVVINVIKIDDYNFTVNNTVITTSDSLVMNLPDDASGNVSVIVGNDTFVTQVINGKAIINGDKLPLGFSDLKASYSGDDKYTSKILSDAISVKCDNYDIIIDDKNLIYDDDLVIELPETASGNLTVSIGNKSYNIPISEGKVIIPGNELPLGYNNVSVFYSGDDKYVPGNLSETISVRADNCNLSIDVDSIVEGDDLVIVLPSDASGNVSVTIGNESFTVPVVDGKATISTENISNGDYEITLSYSGDDKYVPHNSTVNISVVSGIVVTAPDVVKYYSGPERFIVNVADIKGKGIANKTVTITINGVEYSRVTNEYGNVSLPLNLVSGEYTVLINVDDELYNSSVIVNTTIVGNDLVKVYKNDSQYYVTVYDSDGNYLDPGSIVTFNINGVFYTRYVGDDGRVKLNINLLEGTYIITANNTVTGEVRANNVTVISRITDNHDLVKYFRNDSQYCVTLLDDYGNPVGAGVNVTFNINGVFYTRYTNASGVAELNINLQEGEYIITAEYNGCFASNKIVVLPTLICNNMVKEYGTRDQFVANVFDGQGNPYPNQTVTFNIHGVFYNRVSDINGQAKLNINLPAGKYIITSSYGGTSIANNITVI